MEKKTTPDLFHHCGDKGSFEFKDTTRRQPMPFWTGSGLNSNLFSIVRSRCTFFLLVSFMIQHIKLILDTDVFKGNRSLVEGVRAFLRPLIFWSCWSFHCFSHLVMRNRQHVSQAQSDMIRISRTASERGSSPNFSKWRLGSFFRSEIGPSIEHGNHTKATYLPRGLLWAKDVRASGFPIFVVLLTFNG